MNKDRTMYANEVNVSVSNNDAVLTFNLIQPQTGTGSVENKNIVDSFTVFMSHNMLFALKDLLLQINQESKETS